MICTRLSLSLQLGRLHSTSKQIRGLAPQICSCRHTPLCSSCEGLQLQSCCALAMPSHGSANSADAHSQSRRQSPMPTAAAGQAFSFLLRTRPWHCQAHLCQCDAPLCPCDQRQPGSCGVPEVVHLTFWPSQNSASRTPLPRTTTSASPIPGSSSSK